MHHFRQKSSSSATPKIDPPSTPTSQISEFIRRELATTHPRVKDPKALVASSSAIALSICSPPCDPLNNEPGSSKESGWRTAYGAARMAVEITKETSDMFLPLKAVTGALSVLIKNYDVGPLHVSPSRLLTIFYSKPLPMRNRSERSRKEYSRLLRCSDPQRVVRTVRRRRGEGLYASSFSPRSDEIPTDY